MKTSKKVKILNLLILFFTMFGCFFWIYSAFTEFFDTSTPTSTQSNIIVSATTNVYEVEKPIYNIMTKSEGSELERVSISSPADVASTFYNYFDSLQKAGGYAYEAYSVIAGTARKFGQSLTAYQASYMYAEVNSEGDYRFENGTAEVAGPDGEKTGFGKYKYEVITQKGNKQTSQITGNVSVDKMSNGLYKLSPNFNGTSPYASSFTKFTSPFWFKLSEETITECKIVKNTFSYSVELSLNFEGYRNFAEYNGKRANALKTPSLLDFSIKLSFDNFGRVLSLQYSEKYLIELNVIGYEVPLTNVATWAVTLHTQDFSSRQDD